MFNIFSQIEEMDPLLYESINHKFNEGFMTAFKSKLVDRRTIVAMLYILNFHKVLKHDVGSAFESLMQHSN